MLKKKLITYFGYAEKKNGKNLFLRHPKRVIKNKYNKLKIK